MDVFRKNIHWLLRLVVAFIFLSHGLQKFPAEGFAEAFSLPLPLAYLVAVGEVFIAIAVFFGGMGLSWLTRLGGLVIVVIMVGAMVMAPGGLLDKQLDMMLLVSGLAFLFRGNEGFSH